LDQKSNRFEAKGPTAKKPRRACRRGQLTGRKIMTPGDEVLRAMDIRLAQDG
jgi:hypothetical protein